MSNAFPTVNVEVVKEASLRQRDAASPRDNIFVSANAGSGKTKVLVNRVSRLLLNEVSPSKILCLTFTKAAASEMQTRLYEDLGAWSVMQDKELQQTLAKLDGNTAARSPEKLSIARRLFANALETPEGLKVQTIHAFCERLLRRFPIEAGIAPGYDALDDRESAALLDGVKERVSLAALADPSSDLARAISHLAANYDNGKLDGVYRWAASHIYEVADWQAIGLTPLADRLGIALSATVVTEKIAAWNAAPKEAIKAAAHAMSQSGASNQKSAQMIFKALTAPDPVTAYDLYQPVFVTQALMPSASVSWSGVASELFGDKKNGYGHEAQRMFTCIDRIKSVHVLDMTRAVYVLSGHVAKAMTDAKRAARKMDFTDQIRLARALLMNSGAREWVRYKLDGGVDHVLVDEAQDNSPYQWDIIDAVAAEFNATENSGRTQFAVGDEKQSIYSFQGAKPDLFLSRFQELTLKEAKAKNISLNASFRSAPEVLRAVDAVFTDCEGLTEIFDAPPGGADLPRHQASRMDAGRVELWPVILRPETQGVEEAWEFTPLDNLPEASSREQLAQKIAKTIKHWIEAGEQVFDRELKNEDGSKGRLRAMKPGDIMILVRARNAFFNAVIRNLKSEGVAVAGADRLKLTDNIGVQDLISLGRFVALPSDDLSLAEVLKSPIFGLTDDDLISLTEGRERKTLWEALNGISDPQFLEARGVLRKITQFAPNLAPYEFYARVLSTLMPRQDGRLPESVLRRLYARLGVEAADPIEAFLSRALAHQRSGPPSLDRFLRDMEGDGQILKRESDGGQNEVRVMTVHGSKGLEAPVVILPDTTQVPTATARDFALETLAEDETFEGYAIQTSGPETPTGTAPAQTARLRRDMQEYLRLLYVAMTRAESRLVICGFQSGPGKKQIVKPGSWYDWAERAFEVLQTESASEDVLPDGTAILAFGPRQSGGEAEAENAEVMTIPDWAQVTAPPPPRSARRVTPSHLIGPKTAPEPAVRSPLDALTQSAGGVNPFARGIAIHKLLEILPDAVPARRREIAAAYLSAQSAITPQSAAQITGEVFAILDNSEFTGLFAPGSRAEVSLAGRASDLPENIFMNAQIDRLAVSETEVWIVDYKSNRPPPNTPQDVAQIYIAQMAAYRALAREIYPKHVVRCALLWTDEARLMELPEALLDRFNLRAALSGSDGS